MSRTNTVVGLAMMWVATQLAGRRPRWCTGVFTIVVAMAGVAQAQSQNAHGGDILGYVANANWWSAMAQAEPDPNTTSRRTTTGTSDELAAEDDRTNNGEDFTRPVNRFDIRYKYEQQKGTVDTHAWTLRVDSKFKLPSEWELSTRVDLPISRNNKSSSDNPDGEYEAGLGNVLTQALLITPHVHQMAAGGGLRVTWPTVTEPQLGNQKYVLGPTLGGAYYPAWLPKGSLLGALARYEYSVAGRGDEIERLIIQPLVNINLPSQWFVNFQPEMVMNSRQDNNWFIPFDMMLGKKFGRHMVTSLEWKQGLVKDYDAYDWSLEFRIGFFF